MPYDVNLYFGGPNMVNDFIQSNIERPELALTDIS